MAKKAPVEVRVVAQNRKARHNYFIVDKIEAGLVLTGTEVKSMRAGGCQLTDAHAAERDGELWLLNAHIPEYKGGNRFNHEPRRTRKLLVHRRERDKLIGKVQREGMTLVPLSLYFNDRGIAKVELGLAKGKKLHDKRATEKARDWSRERAKLLRARN
jgi:SsrA-binding protein